MIRWAIAKGTTPIIGATKVYQVEDAAKAAAIVLTAEDMAAIKAAAVRTGVDAR